MPLPIPELQTIVDGYLRGETSGPIAVMELLQTTEDISVIQRCLPLLRGDPAGLRELTRLFESNEKGCRTIVRMLQERLDSPEPALRIEEGIARARALFDDSVSRNEEASVALYSLGSPELLAAATSEVVRVMGEWGVLQSHHDALEIGCGIGRFLVPLAARLRSVVGTDVSSGMVDAATRRIGTLPNASARLTAGADLADFADSSFNLVLSIDAFPYIVLSGQALVQSLFREIRRVLRPGGSFVLFNYAYGRSREDDDRDVRAMASATGFDVLRADEAPFTLWNGVGWHLTPKPGSA